MQHKHISSHIGLAILVIIAAVVICAADRQSSGRRLSGSNSKGFNSKCGTADQVSERIGRCLDPIFDLVEGKYGMPMRGDADMIDHCNKFNTTERCVRTIAKDCLSGLHKTSTSAVASATRRFRQQECKTAASRGKYLDPLRCSVKCGDKMRLLYQRFTGMQQGIRDLPISPEQKLLKACCMLQLFDKEMEAIFNGACPASTPLVLGLVHALTDDARSTLCANPKCQGALDEVIQHKYKPPQNFIEPIMQVLFMLNVD